MEYFGLIAFILALYCISELEKIKKIRKKLKMVERKVKGKNKMSKLISDLKGQRCLIKSEEALFAIGDITMECEVIDVDDEWIKIKFKGKRMLKQLKLLE